MAFAQNGGVRLFYEASGDPAAPPVLLLNGGGRQAIDFADAFCANLAARGFRVVRFDQRDTGLSTDFTHIPSDVAGAVDDVAAGRPARAAYDLADLAADAVAVLDAAGIERAHLFGRSLGSLVAQLVALDHPARVLSMTLAISMSRGIGGGITRQRAKVLDTDYFQTAGAFADRQVAVARTLGNPAYFDEARIRADAAVAFARGVHRGALGRHYMVGLAAPDLRPRLSALDLPVQVIQGRLDKVIAQSMGEETASAIPSARLAILDDMAHEAPPELWDRWIDLFVENAVRANA